MRNPSPPSSSSQCKHICLFFLLHALSLFDGCCCCYYYCLLEKQIATKAAAAESIDVVCMYACMHRCRLRRSFSLCVVCLRTHTHTHALTQPSNTQRLIYQSSYVYVRRKRKKEKARHAHTHTRIHLPCIYYYLKQRFTSVRPSTTKSKRRKKEEERH
jgi:hypothetical protein